MNKKFSLILPLLTGAVGFLGRWIQMRVGFDPATGLATGHVIGWLVPVYLAVVCVMYLVLAWRQKEKNLPISTAFTPPEQTLPVFVGGAMLLLAGGAWLAVTALTASSIYLFLGILAVLAGGCLFAAVRIWRQGGAPGNLLLPPVFLYVAWLLITYKAYADYPVTEQFYVEVLALAALALAAYHVAVFAFGLGSGRMFAFAVPLAITLGCTALADALSLPLVLLYAGSVVQIYGFWLNRKR